MIKILQEQGWKVLTTDGNKTSLFKDGYFCLVENDTVIVKMWKSVIYQKVPEKNIPQPKGDIQNQYRICLESVDKFCDDMLGNIFNATQEEYFKALVIKGLALILKAILQEKK